jgi:hypothetical protein
MERHNKLEETYKCVQLLTEKDHIQQQWMYEEKTDNWLQRIITFFC